MQLTLNQWFRKYAKKPVLLVTALIILGQCMYAAFSLKMSSEKQMSSLTRISEIVTIGISQKNRAIIESALSMGISELHAKEISLCENNTSILSFPLDSFACKERKISFFSRAETLPISGMPQYTIQAEMPLIVNQHMFLLVLFSSLLIPLACYLILMLMHQHLKKDIFLPLKQNISEINPDKPSAPLETNILEIQNIYSEYMSKLINLKTLHEENTHNASLAAIAQTTQMFAHDVRKPFSLLHSVLSSIKRARSSKDLVALTNESLQEVEDSMNLVSNMIQDVLEMGTARKPEKIKTSGTALLEKSYKYCKETLETKNIAYSIEREDTEVNVDDERFFLALLNIVTNAIEATPEHGQIVARVEKFDEGSRFIIRNYGSYIPEDKREKIFRPFYTEGKKTGTGLGLAIVNKIVSDHEGKVECKSSATENWTEFCISIPQGIDDVSNETTTVDEPILLSKQSLNVLILEDSKIMRTHLETMFNQSLSPNSLCVAVATVEEAIGAFDNNMFDLVVSDLDLGCKDDEETGFEFIRMTKRKGFKGFICVHSGMIAQLAEQESMDCGADMFIKKTMKMSDVHKLLSLANQKKISQTNLLKEISVLDDNAIQRRCWEIDAEKTVVNTFRNPEHFWKRVEQEPSFLEKQQVVVTDLIFEDRNVKGGIEFAQELRNLFAGPILLSTNAPNIRLSEHKFLTALIGKTASINQLETFI